MYFADRFHDALKNGGRALFLGIGAEQVPQEFRDHPRLIFWDSDSPQIKNANFDELPVRTKVVVATRFLSHSTFNKAEKFCRRANGNVVFMGKLSGTGEITKMLREAIPAESTTPVADSVDLSPAIIEPDNPETFTPGFTPAPEPPAIPDPFPPAPELPFTTVTACVRYYGQREIDRPLPPGRTRARDLDDHYYKGLLARVVAHGFDSDDTRVRAIFSNIRVLHRKRVQREAEQAEVARAGEIAAAANAIAPAPIEVTPTLPLEPLPPNLDKLVGWADELDLKALTAMELANELRAIVREHRALRDVKDEHDRLLAVLHRPRSNGATN